MGLIGKRFEKLGVTREEWGYALYDWANSAYATTVMAGFFPIFFKQHWSAGVDATLSTARLGLGNSIASLVIVFLAPILGAAADLGGGRKRFLFFFTMLSILTTASLAAVREGGWQWAMILYVFSAIGFSGAQIFYDALLPSATARSRYDLISSLGYSMGYLGGGILFLINVLMTLHPAFFGISDAATAVRLSFLSVALWWGGFSVFIFAWVGDRRERKKGRALLLLVREGVGRVWSTFHKVRALRGTFLFLLAYWFYIDGVDTIIKMAVDYGLSLGFGANDLITALLLVQFVGFPAALAYGRMGMKIGVKRSIYLGIGVYCLITLWGAFMTSRVEFYLLAVAIGLVQGGIQSLSRSYYARLIPRGQEAEFFGFYNMLGRFAAIAGPVLMGLTGLGVKWFLLRGALDLQEISRIAARWSMVSVLLLFIVGGLLLTRVDEQEEGAAIEH